MYRPGGGALTGELTLLGGSVRTVMGEPLSPAWGRSGRTLRRNVEETKDSQDTLAAGEMKFLHVFAVDRVTSSLVSAVWAGALSAWWRGSAAVRV